MTDKKPNTSTSNAGKVEVSARTGHPKWFMVCDKATGDAVSVGTVLADPLPGHLEAHEIGDGPHCPDMTSHRWDGASRRVVPISTRDRVHDLQTDPAFGPFQEVWKTLNPKQQEALTVALGQLLGPRRHRRDDEPVGLG